MKREKDESILEVLCAVPGIVGAACVDDADRKRILEIEDEAEEKSLMGLGKVFNAGVRRVLECEMVYVALTSMDFDWGCDSQLLMKKGREIVGEEVREQAKIERLSANKNVWFMHKNFVVYKDRVSFPRDVMKKACHFEIPCHEALWLQQGQGRQMGTAVYGCPSTPTDVFLKTRYFEGRDDRGSGTVLVGVGC